MKGPAYTRHTLCVYAAAMLAGCGGSQPPIGAPGALPQSRAIATQGAHGGSWMLPDAKSDDLLYVSLSDRESNGDEIYVFSYPKGKLVGGLSLPQDYPMGLCSDDKGDLFVTTYGDVNSTADSYVYEFAHGGTQPIATLSDPGFGNDCAVDPTTGNLAVANWFGSLGSFDHGSVAIYQGAQGTATPYYDRNIYWYEWCVYDTNGNLYVDGSNEGGGYPLAELPEGSSSFLSLTLNDESILPESLQWDSGDLVVEGWQWAKHQATENVYQVQLSGSEGTVVETTTIATNTKAHKVRYNPGQYILKGKTLIGAGFNDPAVHLWRFPEGGLPIKSLRAPKGFPAYGVAFSVAPSGSHIRR
jgi:hypothetical protein